MLARSASLLCCKKMQVKAVTFILSDSTQPRSRWRESDAENAENVGVVDIQKMAESAEFCWFFGINRSSCMTKAGGSGDELEEKRSM